MNNSGLNTESIILEAAEAEFLEKGFGSTKMMAIAKRANVSHSMLHYYFRNKENLFHTIFLQKAQTLLPLFENVFEQQLPFVDTVRFIMETQFRFLTQNPKLPLFLITEILTNKDNRLLLFKVLSPKIIKIIAKFNEMLDAEVKKGTIRPIQFLDFFMNIVALNASIFIVLPVLQDMKTQIDVNRQEVLKERLESNIQFVLAALRP